MSPSPLATVDVVGFWIGIFLTFCILSYLYKDNPFYKAAEHLFVGVSIGYVITQQFANTLVPNLFEPLFGGEKWTLRWWFLLVGFVFCVMLLLKAASRRLSWIGRYPLAFVVALYAGIQINAVAQSDLVEQAAASMQPLDAHKVDVNDPKTTAADLATLPGLSPPVAELILAEREKGRRFGSLDELAEVPGMTELQKKDLAEKRGALLGLDARAAVAPGIDWFGTISRILLLAGLIASLVYFYFSVEHKGAIGKVSRFGVWVLMIGFGAAFGTTVQGRLSLAVGRVMDVLGKDKDPAVAAQIGGPVAALISVAIIVTGIILWERWLKRRPPPKPRASDDPPPDDEELPAF